MNTTRPNAHSRPLARGASGFTIIELLTSILVIGLILSILIIGLRFFFAAGQSTKQRAAVTSMKQAVADFKTKFGFLPPLVREKHPNVADRATTEVANSLVRIAVWDDVDLAITPVIVPGNKYFDLRYSVRTLPYYLSGALDLDIRAGGAGGNPPFPIDGVLGGGYYKPNSDGSFRIPAEMLRPLAQGQNPERKLTAEVYEPFIDVGAGDPKIFRGADPSVDLGADDDHAKLQMHDAKGIAYRYYRWTALDPQTPSVVNQNIPLIVGNANDAAVRAAKYAVVGAGPNKAFGDEPINDLLTKIGRPTGYDEVKARDEAASDNIVEVGQ